MRLGIVCGLASEAQALGIEGVAVSGARPASAEAEARRLAAEGVSALLSVGLAGALAPGHHPGTRLVPACVLDGAHVHHADGDLARSLGLPPPAGMLLGSDVLLATAREKAAACRETGAAAVDMESHRVARAAHAAGLPFLAVRVIADPYDLGIPAAAREAITPDGRVRVAATLARLALSPWELPALLRLGRHSATAHAGLRTIGAMLRKAGA